MAADSEGPTEVGPSPRRARSRLAGAVLLFPVLALLVAATCFRAGGGRWLMVSSPSMGVAAPVGTLLLTRPVHAEQVQLGDIVSFHPPTEPRVSFSHRVVAVDAEGGLHTRGDLNGTTDPWTLHTADLTGRVVLRAWGVGWLLRALPLLVIGMLTVWLVTVRREPASWQRPARLLGGSLLVAVCAALLRPFIAVQVVTSVTIGRGAQLSVVSTGVLPLRARVTGGTHTDLRNGHLGTLSVHADHPDSGYHVLVSPHMPLLWWVVIGLVCAVPLLLALLPTPDTRRAVPA